VLILLRVDVKANLPDFVGHTVPAPTAEEHVSAIDEVVDDVV
jgi:hypothetical protein